MEKEKYFRTELDVIHFHTEDVITTSDIVEEDNHEHGSGSRVDPSSCIIPQKSAVCPDPAAAL